MDNSSEIFIRILLTVVFGAILGLETETRQRDDEKRKDEKSRIGGVRTYTILSLFGGIAGVLFSVGQAGMVYIIFGALVLLIVAAYIENIKLKSAFGMTTEIAIFITFILGFLTTSNIVPIEICLFILVILAFFLSQKRGFSLLISKISHTELNDIIKFGLVGLVILPVLPNQNFYIKDLFYSAELLKLAESIPKELLEISIINPFRIWLIIVLISGINLAGYLLSKLVGAKPGIFITAILGGILSSTTTTAALAAKSKTANKNSAGLFAGAAVIANAVSLISVLILISVLHIGLIRAVYLPIVGMFIIGILAGSFIILTSKKSGRQDLEIKYEPFSIGPALKFVAIIVLLTITIQILQAVKSEELVIAVTALSGLNGLDAPTIAISELLIESQITLASASLIFLATNTINFMSKMGIGYFSGSREFTIKHSIGITLTLLGTFLILL